MFDFARGWGDGEAAKTGATDFSRHEVADFAHGVDDLVEGNKMLVIGKCHVGTGEGVGGGHDVFAEAGGFYAICEGVAGHAERVLQGLGGGAELLL